MMPFMRPPLIAPLGIAGLLLLTACSGTDSTTTSATSSIPSVGASSLPLNRQTKPCADAVRAGERAAQSLVVYGCAENGKAVTITTRRCQDGRTYLLHQDLRAFVGGVWEDAGKAHAAVAKKYATC